MKRALLSCLVLSCLALSACGDPPSGGGPSTRPSASGAQASSSGAQAPASAAQPPASAASSSVGVAAPGAPDALTLRPPGANASREEREKAALDLLSGRARAADLPLSDVAPGEVFEPRLRSAMGIPMDIRVEKLTVNGLDEKETSAALEREKMRFRICYAGGVRNNPNLQGRVAGRVTVKPGAARMPVENAGSDVPDSAVIECALAALGKIKYPAPSGPEGYAVVVVLFSPG
jgi:hypothetical protein